MKDTSPNAEGPAKDAPNRRKSASPPSQADVQSGALKKGRKNRLDQGRVTSRLPKPVSSAAKNADDAALAGRPGRGKGAMGGNKKGGGAGRDNATRPKARASQKNASVKAKTRRQIARQKAATLAAEKLPPAAGPARMKKRHWGGVVSFLLLVIAPTVAAIYYLWNNAEDQYVSDAGFIVRSEQVAESAALLGGLAALAGNSVTSEADILNAFIRSGTLVESIDAQLDLRAHYSQHYETDPLFSIAPDASFEDLTSFWARVVKLAYDAGTGLIEINVSAFDPQYAQDINTAVLAASQAMINRLNEQARTDAMSYAVADLEQSVERLKRAREALTQFRTRTQIVDPQADIQSRMGVMTNLQQQLAEALIAFDLLQLNTQPGDPRLRQSRQQIDAIRARIASERQTLSSDIDEPGGIGGDYPRLIAEFESLQVDVLFAEETYRASLATLDLARAEAQRQSLYLATYIRPTLPQSSQAPRRELIAALIAGILLLSWSILSLIYYSLRDRG